MGDPVRILIVDDSEIFTDLMAQAIEADPRATLAGIARDGREAVARVRELGPDVISMDVRGQHYAERDPHLVVFGEIVGAYREA